MDEDKFFQTYSKAVKKTKGIPNLEMNAPVVAQTKKGTVGLELEVEGRNLRLGEGHFDGIRGEKSKAFWQTHEDGSLRNGGREFVLSTPVFVEEIDTMLEGLFKQIALYKGIIENSNRCSTHVHVNIGGKKINEITSAIVLWYMLETAAISWCGEERVSNHFCLSNVEAPSTMRAWQDYLRTGRRPSAEGLKYSALNVLPIWRFGSLEFRCGAAAHEPVRPAQWAKFLASLVDFAGSEFPNPEMIGAACSEIGAARILKNICDKAGLPGSFTDEMLSVSDDFDGECMRNLRNTQGIVYGFPWNEWMEMIDRDYVPNPFGSKASAKAPREVPFPEQIVGEWAEVLDGAPRRGARLADPPRFNWGMPAAERPLRNRGRVARAQLGGDFGEPMQEGLTGHEPHNWVRGTPIPTRLANMNADRVHAIIRDAAVSVARAIEMERQERERDYRAWLRDHPQQVDPNPVPAIDDFEDEED